MRVVTRRVATLATCVATLSTSLTGIARADNIDAMDVSTERPVMYFTVDFTATYQTVCGVGILREPPAPNPIWTLTLVGSTSDGRIIDNERSTFEQNGAVCQTVQKWGAPYATYTAVYRYLAVGDPPSEIVGQALWTPTDWGEMATITQ